MTAPELAGHDRYEVSRRLGAGGMGVVYLAYDRERQEHVALKTLAKVSAAAIYRFKQEFRALAGVAHPNLVQLHELVSHADYWFFTMELVEGVTFLEWVRSDVEGAAEDVITALCTVPSDDEVGAAGNAPLAEPMTFPTVPRPGAGPAPAFALRAHGDARPRGISLPLHVGRLREALKQLVLGVSSLHAAGKLHRDIKPSNVLVTVQGRVVLLDFGLVLDLSAAETDSFDAPLVGTAAYMSPEQGARIPLTPASDWYGVGVVLYQALTGRLPFYGDAVDMLAEKRRVEPTPPRVLVPRIPADLNSLCVDLLRLQPDARPTGAEILRRLDGADTASEEITFPPTHPSGRTGTVPPSPTAADAGPATFLGREQLFAKLTSAFTDVNDSRPVTLFVSGKSGFGKSALVARFIDALAHGNRALVLQGRCYENESVPYKALDSVIDDLSQHLRRMPKADVARLLPAGVGALARVFPVLRRIEPIAVAIRREHEIPDRHELRTRAFGALRDLLRNFAKRRAIVIYIDDVQWGDVDSALVLRDLLRGPQPAAILLLAVYQSEHAETSPVLETLLEEVASAGPYPPDVRKVTVGPLTPYEARDLALALFGRDDKGSRRHAEVIALESGGSPLFVQELVRYAIAASDGNLEHTTPSSLGMTLEQALAMRLSQLPPEALRLLEVICVAGRPIDLRNAVKASALGPDARNAVAQLRAGHLARTLQVGDRDAIEPNHERIASTVIASLPPRRKKAHHRELAIALEDSGGADPETLALHFAGAGDRVRAGEYAVEAARSAAEALAFDRAIRLYHLGVESCTPGERRWTDLSVELGDALAAAGRGADSAHVYLAAAGASEGGRASELRRRAAEQLLRSGHRDEGLSVLAGVLDEVGMALERTPRQVVTSLIAKRLQIRLRGYSFTQKSAEEIAPGTLMKIDAAWTAVIGLGLVDALRAAEFQSRHLLLALSAGEPTRVTRALAAEATYAAAGGTRNTRRTQKLVDEMQELSRRLAQPYPMAMAATVTGLSYYLQGSFKLAREMLERGEQTLRDHCQGVAWDIASAQMFSLATLVYQGELRELSVRVPNLVAEAEARGDLYAATILRTGMRNVAWLVTGDTDEARRQVREAERRWAKSDFLLPHYFMLLGETNIDLYLGNVEGADRRLHEQWPALEKSMLLRVQFLRVESLNLRARVSLALAKQRGGDEAKVKAAERDASAMEKEDAPWADASAQLIRTGVAVARQHLEAAADHLTSAAVGFEGSDMKLHATVSRRWLGELKGGEEGRLRIEAADSWMRSEGVREPTRLAAVVAPLR